MSEWACPRYPVSMSGSLICLFFLGVEDFGVICFYFAGQHLCIEVPGQLSVGVAEGNMQGHKCVPPEIRMIAQDRGYAGAASSGKGRNGGPYGWLTLCSWSVLRWPVVKTAG